MTARSRKKAILLTDSDINDSLFVLYQNDRVQRGGDGAVVRALASQQCVPGSILGPGVICGLSLLLVLYSAPFTITV